MALLKAALGYLAPLRFSVPQLIKDKLKSQGFDADAIPMSFYQEMGDEIIAKARSLSASRMEQARICTDIVEEVVLSILANSPHPIE
jgi:hypothetical protein